MTNQNQERAGLADLFDGALKQVQSKVPDKWRPLCEKALREVFYEGKSPSEAMNISSETIEKLYQQGYHLFKSGKFKEALEIFVVLNQLSLGTDSRFLYSIAATHHQMKQYDKAAAHYLVYQILYPTDPYPCYYLYDCFKNMGEPLMAKKSLMAVEAISKDTPSFADLKTKAQLELGRFQTVL